MLCDPARDLYPLTPHSMNLLLLAATAAAFYLPGIAPVDYSEGDSITMTVNRIMGAMIGDDDQGQFTRYTQFSALDYYREEFAFCKPEDGPKAVPGSLGSVLFGDRIWTSPIQFKVLEDVECQKICAPQLSALNYDSLYSLVLLNYHYQWYVDNLPIAGTFLVEKNRDNSEQDQIMIDKIPIGTIHVDTSVDSSESVPEAELHNHFDFVIEYHPLKNGKYRIVGALADGSSKNTKNTDPFTCASDGPLILKNAYSESTPDDKVDLDLVYSYSVKWVQSEKAWATRWDKFLHVFSPSVNWFALINSTVVVVFVAVITSLVITRMLRKDIAQYNEVDLAEDITDEMGWKLVHGDVFRPPTNTMLYSIVAGTGTQLVTSVFASVFVAMLGLLSPANRGWFSTSLLLFASLTSAVGGYVSAACYKIWGGSAWKLNLVLTPLVVPGLVFGMFLLLNFFMIFHHASGAVPFGSICALVAIWFLISIPLSVFSGFFAFRRNWGEPPVRVNQIPRQIPTQPWYLNTIIVSLLSGFAAFLGISVQMYYIYSAIWFQRLYYMFGFLFVSLISVVLIAAVTNALVLYLSLRAENYKWQWRTFWVCGGCAIYLFIYSIIYMTRYMALQTFWGKAMYIAYCLLASMLCYTALGSIGILSSYILVKNMYKHVKVD